MLARTWSSLDHLTNGRVGWNVVTSYSKEVAFALGLTDVVAHDKRYEMADEFMDVVYKYVLSCLFAFFTARQQLAA